MCVCVCGLIVGGVWSRGSHLIDMAIAMQDDQRIGVWKKRGGGAQ